MTNPDKRLRKAAILLSIRGLLYGLLGLPFLATAAGVWIGRTAANNGSSIGDRLGLLIPTGVLFGIAGASLAFASMILNWKRRALWGVVFGESLLAILLVAAVIWALAYRGDDVLAAAAMATVVIVSVPVIVLLVWTLARGTPAGAREGGY